MPLVGLCVTVINGFDIMENCAPPNTDVVVEAQLVAPCDSPGTSSEGATSLSPSDAAGEPQAADEISNTEAASPEASASEATVPEDAASGPLASEPRSSESTSSETVASEARSMEAVVAASAVVDAVCSYCDVEALQHVERLMLRALAVKTTFHRSATLEACEAKLRAKLLPPPKPKARGSGGAPPSPCDLHRALEQASDLKAKPLHMLMESSEAVARKVASAERDLEHTYRHAKRAAFA